MNESQPILILGGGKMGGALAARWHAARLAPVHVVERDAARRAELGEYGILTHATLADAPGTFSALVLAIKPQQFAGMVAELKAYVSSQPKTFASSGTLVVSIMAGISLAALQQISPCAVRVMPNLPAMIGESMSVGCAPNAFEADRAQVVQLFEAVGRFAWVGEEHLLHAATAISGSGPAYLFAFMEALQAAAIAQGLDAKIARGLVTQTMLGSAMLAEASDEDIATLRRNVTSPGGTTEAALAIFEKGRLDDLVKDATAAAALRSNELSR